MVFGNRCTQRNNEIADDCGVCVFVCSLKKQREGQR